MRFSERTALFSVRKIRKACNSTGTARDRDRNATPDHHSYDSELTSISESLKDFAIWPGKIYVFFLFQYKSIITVLKQADTFESK